MAAVAMAFTTVLATVVMMLAGFMYGASINDNASSIIGWTLGALTFVTGLLWTITLV